MEATVDDLPAQAGRNFRLRPGVDYDRLTPLQRRVMVGAIVVAHVAGLWAVLQVRAVRDAVADVAPIFVNLVAPEAPPKIAPPPPPPPTPQVRRPITPEPRLVTAAPSPAPAPFVAPPPPDPVPPEPAPVTVAAAVAPVVPPPAPAPPRNLSASSVQYLEPLQVEYPRLSKRLGETGLVTLRVFIDEAGVFARRRSVAHRATPASTTRPWLRCRRRASSPPPRTVSRSSGYAQVPVDFQLEK